MLKAIKIRLYPNEDQMVYMNKLFGTCRFVYNQLLAYRIHEYKERGKSVTFGELGRRLVALKSEYEWIKESHSKVLQQEIIDLNFAYSRFFREKKGFPNFKSKHNTRQSVRFPNDAISGISGNRISIITTLKKIHFKCSARDEKYLNSHQHLIKSGTLSKNRAGQIYFSILMERSNTKSLSETEKSVGIDLGIKDFVITSDGDHFENIKTTRNNERKLARLHRSLSRKKKGSKNRNKSRVKLAKYHNKLNNKKEHYLHQVANQLLSENQTIVIEDLNVAGMLKNHNLARSIQELSLSRFRNILTYKANWYGRNLVVIDRFFPSSKLCSDCGHKNTELTLNDREWTCPECGVLHDRDLNAARNILTEGKRLVGLSSPELTLVESSGYTLDETRKECSFNNFH